MTPWRVVPSAAAFWLLAAAAQAEPMPAGLYEVEVRIAIPNVATWDWRNVRRVCLAAAGLPIPVLSPNNPYAGCHAQNVQHDNDRLTYDIACDGRGAARAHASYALLPEGFSGEIAMVLGAKNMTMRELQTGRRLGSCALAAAQD